MVNRTKTDATDLEGLAGATICVQSGTTTELNLTDQMRARNLEFTPLVFAEIDPTYEAYSQGRCDAVTSDRSQLVARRTALTTPADHELLNLIMSKEPLGPVAPLGDDQWFNIVKWTVFVTFEAEELGITQANVAQERDSSTNPVVRRLLGAEAPELGTGLGLEADWVVDVITRRRQLRRDLRPQPRADDAVQPRARAEPALDPGRPAVLAAVPLSRSPDRRGH